MSVLHSSSVVGLTACVHWTAETDTNICTIAVMSYVADMSSDVMGYTEPIISCVLSDNTQHKTGN